MATNKNITMKQYNGLDYDTLYPKTTPEQVGAVSYEAQTLTDEQKAQARTNINAAPGGFGLGETIPKQISSWDEAVRNGWYKGPAPDGIGSGSLWGRVDSLSDTYVVQTIYSDVDVATAQRFRILSAWKPWEWVNPPMQLGVEYRTTERYRGKPVYVKLFDCGTIPAQGTHKDLVFSSDADDTFSVTAYSPQRGDTLPNYDANGVRYAITGTGVGTVMIWNYSESRLDTNVHALIKYTKTTD